MEILYIGETAEWIEKFKALLKEEIAVFPTAAEAQRYLTGLRSSASSGAVFLFLESVDTDKDIARLSFLRKEKKENTYFILITDHLSPKLVYKYISSGVNEIIDVSISAEELGQILSLLPRLKKSEVAQEQTKLFKLPLWKRVFDIFFSGMALICLSPLLLFTALVIRLESKGSVIYTSQRVGSNYRIFGFLKFRSMYTDADKRLSEYKKLNQYQTIPTQLEKKYYRDDPENAGTIFVGDDFRLTEEEFLARRKKLKENNFIKLQNDPRVTRVGRFIRKYSIDELPQLINILKGDMSVVGNRPLPLYEAELLTSDEYIERFMAPAGLTGLWQVEKRGTEGILSAEERKQLDIQYARKFSFWFDVRIILRTFAAFIQKENV